MGKASRKKATAQDSRREAQTLHYDRKAPCSDCPFRKNAPFHEGILNALPNYHAKGMKGELAHSCHLSDPRADCAADKRAPEGAPVQHCAGWLALVLKDKVPMPGYILQALVTKQLPMRTFDTLAANQDTFASLDEMALYYGKLAYDNSPAIRAEMQKLGYQP